MNFIKILQNEFSLIIRKTILELLEKLYIGTISISIFFVVLVLY